MPFPECHQPGKTDSCPRRKEKSASTTPSQTLSETITPPAWHLSWKYFTLHPKSPTSPSPFHSKIVFNPGEGILFSLPPLFLSGAHERNTCINKLVCFSLVNLSFASLTSRAPAGERFFPLLSIHKINVKLEQAGYKSVYSSGSKFFPLPSFFILKP